MKNIYFPLIGIFLLLASCENESVEPQQIAEWPTHLGVVANVDCGLYIKLDQGQKIFDNALPNGMELQEGQRVELSYRPVPRPATTSTSDQSCYEDDQNNTSNHASTTTSTTPLDPLTQCMNGYGIEKVQISKIKQLQINT